MNYIKLLRGAPLTIFVALIKLGGKATKSQIMRMTGYSFPTIRKACQDLVDAGLTMEDNFGEWNMADGGPQLVFGKQKSFLPTTALNIDNSKQDSLLLTEVEAESFLLLKGAGIGEPMRTRLAKKHAPEYISAQVAYCKREHKSVGILIHRIDNGDPIPEDPSAPKDYLTGEFAGFIEH